MTPVERQLLVIKRAQEFERVIFDTVIKAGDTQQFEFKYKENINNIEGFRIGCRNCTKVKKEGNSIVATFTAPPEVDYADRKSRGETFENYTSSITVYFKDGEPVQKFNEDGQLKDNPDKVTVSLQIRAMITF